MTEAQDKPDKMDPDFMSIVRSLRNDAEKQLARSPLCSHELKCQTSEELIHELQVHQIDLSNRAVELAEAGQYDEALALVNKGIRLDANNANSWYNKGIILFKMCRYHEALNSFAQAADIDPELS